MIVAMFTNNFSPIVSGVTTSVTRLERGLTKRGHVVHIFAPWVPGHRDTHETVHRVPSLPLPAPLIPLPIPHAPGLARAVAAVRPDIFHAHHPFLLGRDALRLARRMQRPIVFTYHAMYEEYVHNVPVLPEAPLRRIVFQRALDFAQRVDAVIVPSSSLATILTARGLGTSLHVIPTGINPALFRRNDAVRQATRQTWRAEPNDVVIVSFARLSKEKHFDLLLSAFARLRQQHPKAALRLVIGGDGPEQEALQRQAHELRLGNRVLFAGFVPHDAVPSFLAGGDLFAYTSQSETQGLVTLEALAAGLPAVVVDAPGNRDIVQHEVSGMVTEATAEAVAEGLGQLVERRDLREQRSREARRRAEDFSEEHFAERVEALYVSLASPRYERTATPA